MAGQPLHDARDLTRGVLAHDPGQTLLLETIRDGKHYAATVTLAPRHEDPPEPVPVQQQGVPHPGLGMSVRDISQTQAAQVGVTVRAPSVTVITDVVAGSAADRAGLKKGDLVTEVDGKQDPSSSDVQTAATDGQIVVRVQRRGAAFYAALHK